MKSFELDPRLRADCIIMHETREYILLLMNNALAPWLILVPKVAVTELYELEEAQQLQLQGLINRLCRFIKAEYAVDKLNVAAIGNIVSQLHIHIVGRRQNDYCWPGVVWGAEGRESYQPDEAQQLSLKLRDYLGV